MARVKSKKKKRDLAGEIDALKADVLKLTASVDEARRLLDEKRIGAARALTEAEFEDLFCMARGTARKMRARRQLRCHRFTHNTICYTPEDLDWAKKTFAVIESQTHHSLGDGGGKKKS